MATKKKPTKRTKPLKALNEQLREPGTIASVFYGTEDHGIVTCWLYIKFKGSQQGFGGLCLPGEYGPDFVSAVCGNFGVPVLGTTPVALQKSLEQLIGEPCYALRCFDTYNTNIEGLENQYGDAFLLTTWRRSRFPNTESPLEHRRQSYLQTIANAKRQIFNAERELETLDDEYYDWETR